MKKRDVPGSPCRPARPRNWLSIRLASWRVVPMTYRPPSSTTRSRSIGGLPPSRMSVPRPAMFVDTVTAPSAPARAMISASASSFLAFRTECGMPGQLQAAAQRLRFFHAGRSHQNRTTRLVNLSNFFRQRAVASLFVGIHHVRQVFANHRPVGWNHRHRQFVDLPEFAGLRGGGAGHAADPLIHPARLCTVIEPRIRPCVFRRTRSLASMADCKPAGQRWFCAMRPLNSSTSSMEPSLTT